MSKVKLIAIDMDGTLLNNDSEISPRVKEAILKAREKGTEMTLCTGRMYASAVQYASKLEINVPLITYDGALVKNSSTGEVLYNRLLPLDEAIRIIEKCKEYDFHINCYIDDSLYVENISEVAKKYAEVVRVPINKVDSLVKTLKEHKSGPLKLLAIGDNAKLNHLREELLSEGMDIYMTTSGNYFLEFLHKEATKGHGLKAVADIMGIKREEIMAIGDNENDIAMFKYAGIAVAMENAIESVKKHADFVTKSNECDGVAIAIEKFVLKE